MKQPRNQFNRTSGWTYFFGSLLVASLLVGAIFLRFGPRNTISSVGVVIGLILFWPIALTLCGFLIGLLATIFSGEDSGAGDAAEVGITGSFWYYSRLLSAKNPLFWGGLAGATLSVGCLYLYAEYAIYPRERQALNHLNAIADEIYNLGRQTGQAPSANSQLLHEALGLNKVDSWKGHSLIDPWGNPIYYEKKSSGYSTVYEVASPGWNGRREPPGRGVDDIVVERIKTEKRSLTKDLLEKGKKKLIDHLRKRLDKSSESAR